jgi:class 3 adenylate cyclase
MQLSSIDVIASALEPAMPDLGEFSSPDGALTLMLTDIADAPAVAERLGAEAWNAVVRDHETLVRQIVAHHDGSIVRSERDGFLISFPSAHAGLHCAVEMQRAFGEGDVAVRTGLHSGFVIANPDQLLGRNVVLAARIAGRATAGEILVSSTLKAYTERDPSFAFEELGEFHFKGLHGEHVLYSVRPGTRDGG